MQVVFFGSKHVHVGVGWRSGGVDVRDVTASIRALSPPARYELVLEMLPVVHALLSDDLVRFIAAHRLVLNSEFVSPQGACRLCWWSIAS